MRLAHLSDPHIAPLPKVNGVDLLSKRITGYINWRRKRHLDHDRAVLDALVRDVHAQKPDHIVITGDLVNLALSQEIEQAARWLERVGTPDEVTIIPGNHDAYVPGALSRAISAWKPYLLSDGASDVQFPVTRTRGPIHLLGLSSAIATGPFMATGRVGSYQLQRLRQALRAASSAHLVRIVMVHHPVQPDACPSYKSLTNADEVCALVKEEGADLILHGHTHLPTHAELPGPGGPVPVLGVASASQAIARARPAADYNLFEINEGTERHLITHRRRRSTHDGLAFEDVQPSKVYGAYAK